MQQRQKPKGKLIGDTFAIEIKPKQGWKLPGNVKDFFAAGAATATITATPTRSQPDTRLPEVKTTRCRYCEMQFLKVIC